MSVPGLSKGMPYASGNIRASLPRLKAANRLKLTHRPDAGYPYSVSRTGASKPILTAANGVIDLATERFTKNLWTDRNSAERPHLVSVRDEADQARYIVERVLENREGGSALKQQDMRFHAPRRV